MGNFCGKCGTMLQNGACPNCDKPIEEPSVESVLNNYPWLFKKAGVGKSVASVFLCILLTIVFLLTFSLSAVKRGLSKDSIDSVVEEIPAINTALTSVITDLLEDFNFDRGEFISKSDVNLLANSPSFRRFISDKLSSYIDSAINGEYWYITKDEIYFALSEAKAEMGLRMSDTAASDFADWAYSEGKFNNAANNALEEVQIPKPLTYILSGAAFWIMLGLSILIIIGLILINFSQGLNSTGIALIISTFILSIPIVILKFIAKNAVNYITDGAQTNEAIGAISESDSIIKIINELLSSALWFLLIFLALGIVLLIIRKPLLKLFRHLFSKKAKS